MLNELKQEEKDHLLLSYVKSGSVDSALDIFQKDYPEAYIYTRAMVYNYLRSEDGKRDLSRIKSESEVKALEEGLSQKANRVIVVAEVGMKIYAALKNMGPEDKEFLPLSRELRECIKDIRVEMEGEGSTSGDATEAAMRFFTYITAEGAPDWIKQAVSPNYPPNN